jgi:hypothetical protein
MNTITKGLFLAVLAATLVSLFAGTASAYHYGTYDGDAAYQPIYQTGYYYNTVAYGYSGWDYHRIYYKYHYPYSTDWYYGYGYGQYNALPYGWTRWQYAYPVNPGYVGYPTPGYYW